MTDEVAELVLDDNRAQTLALVIARRQALPMVNVHARYLDLLETEGWLNRRARVPADRQADRRAPGRRHGPDDARVRRADRLHEERQHRRDGATPTCPTTRTSSPTCRYFPTASCAALPRRDPRAPAAPRDHRHADRQPDGEPVRHLVRPPHDRGHRRRCRRRDACLGCRPRHLRLRRRCGTRSTHCRRTSSSTPARAVPRCAAHGRARRAVVAAPPPAAARHRSRRRRVPARHRRAVDHARGTSCAAGCATRCSARGGTARRRRARGAGRSGRRCGRCCTPGSTSIELAHASACTVREAAAAYWELFDALDLGWLWDAIGALPRSDRWQTQARSALRDDLLTALADLADDVLVRAAARRRHGSPPTSGSSHGRWRMLTEIRRADTFDLTTLSVACASCATSRSSPSARRPA